MPVSYLGIPKAAIEAVAAEERHELERREKAYRDNLPAPEIEGKIVILVDDGLATGATMRAAAIALKDQNPSKSSLPFRFPRPKPALNFGRRPAKSSARQRPNRFTASGVGIRTFRKLPTPRFAGC